MQERSTIFIALHYLLTLQTGDPSAINTIGDVWVNNFSLQDTLIY